MFLWVCRTFSDCSRCADLLAHNSLQKHLIKVYERLFHVSFTWSFVEGCASVAFRRKQTPTAQQTLRCNACESIPFLAILQKSNYCFRIRDLSWSSSQSFSMIFPGILSRTPLLWFLREFFEIRTSEGTVGKPEIVPVYFSNGAHLGISTSLFRPGCILYSAIYLRGSLERLLKIV